MGEVTARLQGLLPELPPAERRVAERIVTLGERVMDLTVWTLAEQSDTSAASVGRLAKRLGCDDYRQLKLEIARDSGTPLTAVHEDILPGDGDADIIRKILGGTIGSLEETTRILDVPAVNRVAKAIAATDQLIFLGSGSSGHVAQDAALRFAHLGIRAAASVEPVTSVVLCSNTAKGSVVVGVSHSGRSSTTVKGLKIASERGAMTVGISNYSASPLNDVSDVLFCTAFRETSVRAVALSSRICQIFVLDALYALVASRLKGTRGAEDINRVVDAECRIRQKRTRRRKTK